jgi:hypothetical protein
MVFGGLGFVFLRCHAKQQQRNGDVLRFAVCVLRDFN